MFSTLSTITSEKRRLPHVDMSTGKMGGKEHPLDPDQSAYNNGADAGFQAGIGKDLLIIGLKNQRHYSGSH